MSCNEQGSHRNTFGEMYYMIYNCPELLKHFSLLSEVNNKPCWGAHSCHMNEEADQPTVSRNDF